VCLNVRQLKKIRQDTSKTAIQNLILKGCNYEVRETLQNAAMQDLNSQPMQGLGWIELVQNVLPNRCAMKLYV